MGKIYLITGGVRSGKSKLGLKLAEKADKPFFIATAWAGDDEMAERIKNHKAERSDRWTTLEERFELAKAVEQAENNNADLIVIDCITLWANNLILNNKNTALESRRLCEKLQSVNADVVMVTNEVGLGIVPDNKIARDYRDLLGDINQKLAEAATDVLLMVSGLPLKVK
ncbi:MAG: bifunctional adenosylcobinamide kinase/adenosylcobinamide-phosphate guanylyltransferase [Victivallales bacterium]|nr:bifunctional adenosylcobinamide kinase/adenosylcobinamide-phosphate guanylyltransferase [Victivallales bacterium]MCF7888980.1 bifunctional adenosylcobinamide kinase/adenosylcobinamide-phosphate guanylyltransferase [Victivallales bacterium]